MKIRSSDTDEKFNIGTHIPYTLIILVILSILSGLAYGWKVALDVFLYGVLCGLVALTGLTPIVGPAIYWFVMSSYVNPLISLPTILKLVVFVLGLFLSIIYTIIGGIVILVLIKE